MLLAGLLRADAVRQAGEPFSLTPPFMVGCQAFLAWLLYFYTALALRENVLKVLPARGPGAFPVMWLSFPRLQHQGVRGTCDGHVSFIERALRPARVLRMVMQNSSGLRPAQVCAANSARLAAQCCALRVPYHWFLEQHMLLKVQGSL